MYLCPMQCRFMLLTRNQFFVLLLAVFVFPIIGYKVYWLACSQRTMGVVCFTGHTLETDGISSHPVLRFKAGKDSIFFNGNSNLRLPRGALVPVRYQKDTPSDARVDIPLSIWGDTLAWSMSPFLAILVLYSTPRRLDPLVPFGCRIRLGGRRPFIWIITKKNNADGYSLR